MSTAAVIITIGMANDLHWVWVTVLLHLWRVARTISTCWRGLERRLGSPSVDRNLAVLAGAEMVES
jgi:hypothetical protein